MRDYMRRYRAEGRYQPQVSKDEWQSLWRGRHAKVRRKAIECLGGCRCVECGCDEYSVLEINHRDGGGRKDQIQRKNIRSLYRDIITGRVDRSKYNVLCRVCNAVHYVRDLLGVNGHVVEWRRGQESNPLPVLRAAAFEAVSHH